MRIHLEPKDVPAHLRALYNGKKFQIETRESVVIPSQAGVWSGGSRDIYSAVDLATGRTITPPWQSLAHPGDASRVDIPVTLTPAVAVMRHTFFCGKDMGVVFYIHPQAAAPLLPPPVALTELEKAVLDAHAGVKSSYAGIKDYRAHHIQTRDRYASNPRPVPTIEAINATREALKARGYLNKAGAITVSGRNALGSV